jgi:hypothetical protein
MAGPVTTTVDRETWRGFIMKKIDMNSYSITNLIKRALEGNVSPLNFVLVLGFFSSLVLLYIALHVHCYTVSQDLNENAERLELLMDQNAFLTAQYNALVSPDRIIPLVEQMGMRPGTPDEMRKFALYEYRDRKVRDVEQWASAAAVVERIDKAYILAAEPEGR